jgi:hypothetical protein
MAEVDSTRIAEDERVWVEGQTKAGRRSVAVHFKNDAYLVYVAAEAFPINAVQKDEDLFRSAAANAVPAALRDAVLAWIDSHPPSERERG